MLVFPPCGRPCLKCEQRSEKSCPSLVPRYATITRHLNVVKIILHGTFDERKIEIRF